jgi:hypothetical protein
MSNGKRVIQLTGLSGLAASPAQQEMAARAAGSQPQKKVISLKGLTLTGSSAAPTAPQDPCATADRLIKLGHPKEAQSWLDLCNKQKAAAAAAAPVDRLTSLYKLLDYWKQQQAQHQESSFQSIIDRVQASIDQETGTTSAAVSPVQDPNSVAISSYADAIGQGASPEQAQQMAQNSASSAALSNTQTDVKKQAAQKKAFFAGLGGLAGFALMSMHPVGAVAGALIGFFAPDVFKAREPPTT